MATVLDPGTRSVLPLVPGAEARSPLHGIKIQDNSAAGAAHACGAVATGVATRPDDPGRQEPTAIRAGTGRAVRQPARLRLSTARSTLPTALALHTMGLTTRVHSLRFSGLWPWGQTDQFINARTDAVVQLADEVHRLHVLT